MGWALIGWKLFLIQLPIRGNRSRILKLFNANSCATSGDSRKNSDLSKLYMGVLEIQSK
jgi:hypothetical protein